PCRLGVAKPGLLMRGVEAQDVPEIIVEREEARFLLPREARIGEEKIEVCVPARIHVVIPVQAPGTKGVAGLAVANRPAGEKIPAIFSFQTGIIDVTQVDDVLLAP